MDCLLFVQWGGGLCSSWLGPNDENVSDDASENNENGSENECIDAEDKEIGIEKYRNESKIAQQLIAKERIKNSSETEESKRAKKEEPEPLPFIPLEPPPKPRQDEFQFQQCELSTTWKFKFNRHVKKLHAQSTTGTHFNAILHKDRIIICHLCFLLTIVKLSLVRHIKWNY